MKKGFMKCIAVIMVVIMTAVYMPVTDISELFAIDASAATYSGGLGGSVKWAYDSSNKTVVISGSGNMSNYGSTPGDFTKYRAALVTSIYKHATKIVINNGVTGIGNNVFRDFAKVTEVSIPASVTSIGQSAFEGCGALTKVNFPANLKTVGAYAFKNTKITSTLALSDSLTSIGNYAFANATGVKFTCNYGTYAYDYCVKNNVTFTFKQNNLVVSAKLDTANKQVVVNLKMFYNKANVNAANFNLTYSSSVAPASTETFYEMKDGIATGIVYSEGKVSVAVMAQNYVPQTYVSAKGPCTYDIAELRFNVNGEADNAEFTFSCDTLMMNDKKATVNSGSSTIGLHSYKDVVVSPSTCKVPGVKNTECEICGKSTPSDLPLDMNNHKGETELVNEKTPGCNEKGYTGDIICKDCNAVISKGNVLGATGNHDYEKVVTAPTCTKTGFTTYTCKVCKTSYTADETPLKAHDYEKVVTAPTCTKTGFTTYTCKVCKASYTADETPVVAHEYEKTVTPPTCKAEGYTTYKCKTCDDSYVADKTPVSDHDYNKVVTEPTCTEGGFTVYTCKYCDDTYTGDITSKLGHNFDDSGKCTRCGAAADVSLKFSDDKTYVINEETKVVYIKKSVNSEDVLSAIVSGNWVINKADGNAAEEGKLVVTGNVIKSANSDLTYTVAVLGDVNCDGKVNALDARAVLRVGAQLDPKTDVILLAGDCDGKAGVTAMDARLILRVGAQIQTF